MQKLKIIFFGTPSFVIPVLSVLVQNFDLVAVVTNPDQKVGRHQILTPSPVKQWAQERHPELVSGSRCRNKRSLRPRGLKFGMTVITPEKFDSQIANRVSQIAPDLIVVASFGKIIPQEILDIPKFGAINIHPSLLPKYRGASPIQSAVLNGDKTTGISIIKMDAKMDHGPIIYAEEFGLSNLDTFENLSTNMFARSSEILPKIIPQFVQNLIPAKPQNDSDATYTKIIKKEDGFFDIDNPPSLEILDRMIRTYYPWPNAWTKFRIKNDELRIKLLPNGLIQMEGKKPVTLAEFLNGYPNFPLRRTMLETLHGPKTP